MDKKIEADELTSLLEEYETSYNSRYSEQTEDITKPEAGHKILASLLGFTRNSVRKP